MNKQIMKENRLLEGVQFTEEERALILKILRVAPMQGPRDVLLHAMQAMEKVEEKLLNAQPLENKND